MKVLYSFAQTFHRFALHFFEQLASFLEQLASFSMDCEASFLEHEPAPHFLSGAAWADAALATNTAAKAMRDVSFMWSLLRR